MFLDNCHRRKLFHQTGTNNNLMLGELNSFRAIFFYYLQCKFHKKKFQKHKLTFGTLYPDNVVSSFADRTNTGTTLAIRCISNSVASVYGSLSNIYARVYLSSKIN